MRTRLRAVGFFDRELVDRHQLDGRDAERFQVRNLLDRRRRTCPGASTSLDGLLREAADVHLVDDRFGERPLEVAVAFPIERVVDHDALGRADDAVVGRQEAAGQRAGVGVDQPGLRVEALALAGIERAVGLEVVKLARP